MMLKNSWAEELNIVVEFDLEYCGEKRVFFNKVEILRFATMERGFEFKVLNKIRELFRKEIRFV